MSQAVIFEVERNVEGKGWHNAGFLAQLTRAEAAELRAACRTTFSRAIHWRVVETVVCSEEAA